MVVAKMDKSARIASWRASLGILGFGAASLGNVYAAVADGEAEQAVASALKTGIRYFDTAPLYGHGLSEMRLGRGLTGVPRETFIVSSKVGRLLVDDPAMPDNFGGYFGIPKLRPVYDYTEDGAYRSIAASLDRLKLDRIDIAFIHDIDRRTHGDAQPQHFRDAMKGAYRALESLRAQGALTAIGIGVNEADVCLDAAREGDFDLFLLASRYTLLEQAPLDTLFPLCLRRGIGIVVGGPYSTGILATGAIEGARYNYRPAPDGILDQVRRMEAICHGYHVPLPAAALQFCAHHPAIASIIPGARSSEEVHQNDRLINLPIPAAFWHDMKSEGLLRSDAPTP